MLPESIMNDLEKAKLCLNGSSSRIFDLDVCDQYLAI